MHKKVYLIGVGPGDSAAMTVAARQAIDESPVLVGAKRLLSGYPDKTCVSAVLASEVAAAVERAKGPVAVLLSGDIGFYSGAKKLYPLLAEYEVEALPGLSSVVQFCARLHTPWEDLFLVSAHGRAHNAPGEVQCHPRTFLLTGGDYRVERLCADLCQWGLGHVTVHAGENLGYPDERITSGTAEELSHGSFDSLAVALVENPAPVGREFAAPGIPDDAFLRGSVPMTKEEVRTLAVSRLHLRRDDTVWDVGAGTGSVSVECALAAAAGRVFAVECKDAAVELLRRNKERFGVTNLHIIPGMAPEALTGLPVPDRVFVGGSSGNLEEILTLVLEKNPACRVVVTAVTLETLSEAARVFPALGLGDGAPVQISVTRTRAAGRYHLMDAQNPVWILWGERT